MGIKFNSLKTFGYNWLNKIIYNSDYDIRLIQLLTRIGPRPIVLNKNSTQVAILENSFDVILEQEVGGIDELTFSLPMNDSKRELIENEGYIQMFDDIYVIREIIDRKKSKTTEVYAEALWYDLAYCEPMEDLLRWETKSAREIMSDLLINTGWKLGTVVPTSKRTYEIVDISKSRLAMFRELESLFKGELWFDTQAKTVSLLDKTGFETGASIMYEKNADEIEAYYDTREMISKLYIYGANNLTIKTANNDVPYLEVDSNNLRIATIKDERYTNAYSLKDAGQEILDEFSKPRVSYVVKMGEVAERQGLEHEKFVIGGIVRAYDKELGMDINTRIMKWSYNVVEPWKTTFDLESKIKTLSDLLSGNDDDVLTFSSEESGGAEMLNLSVFNYLMNSRADDGFNYWTNNGWVIDPINGATGSSSFKAVSNALGQEKTLFQTVYPSSSDNYAISFESFTENIQKGPNGEVSVEIIITYDDNTTETVTVKLI